jgi:hypothetical protein
MEKSFDKLIKTIESCENTKQFNGKFLHWVNQVFFNMSYALENFEEKQQILHETVVRKSNEICQN